jgi:hypothetical protein
MCAPRHVWQNVASTKWDDMLRIIRAIQKSINATDQAQSGDKSDGPVKYARVAPYDTRQISTRHYSRRANRRFTALGTYQSAISGNQWRGTAYVNFPA